MRSPKKSNREGGYGDKQTGKRQSCRHIKLRKHLSNPVKVSPVADYRLVGTLIKPVIPLIIRKLTEPHIRHARYQPKIAPIFCMNELLTMSFQVTNTMSAMTSDSPATDAYSLKRSLSGRPRIASAS